MRINSYLHYLNSKQNCNWRINSFNSITILLSGKVDGGVRVDGKLFAISDIVCKLFSGFYAKKLISRRLRNGWGNGIFKLWWTIAARSFSDGNPDFRQIANLCSGWLKFLFSSSTESLAIVEKNSLRPTKASSHETYVEFAKSFSLIKVSLTF